MPAYVEVALAVPSEGTFQYSIPEHLKSQAAIGKRAYVCLRQRPMVGYIVAFSNEKISGDVKDLESIIDEEPILERRFLDLTRWMAEYYLCSWGQAIEAVFPAPFKKGKLFMKSRGQSGVPNTEASRPLDLELTAYQQSAIDRIKEPLLEGKNAAFLLYGITGSGKTEVYMRIIEELLRESYGSIVLVPEISLTPQTVERFQAHFGATLAVIHSRLSQGKRVEEWHRIRRGEAKVVVGARSAVFSPVKNLRLIVIDEEHDTSYKQQETPRYETRQVALKRAEIENAVVILGSATPSLEAFRAAEEKKLEILELPERIEKRPLPVVEIVDMRRQPHGKEERIFSTVLTDQVKESLAKKEQVMLLLNRRGFSTYLHCATCGYVMTCPQCRISLVYHFDKKGLFCHVCHYRSLAQRLCPSCQKGYIHYFGMGTQKVEVEAQRLFPEARIGRMDSDSMAKKGSHEAILRSFKKGEIDILIGTQMIAKGHDFPNVSLIGVISADTALHVPDFRSAERTFDLLTQVAGRAGRGQIPGKVIVQTFVPHHYSIQSAKDHDYKEFYEKEIIFRKELAMPPFTHLVQMVVSGRDEKVVMRQSMELVRMLGGTVDGKRFSVLGPAPCVVSKENGFFRWNFYLKGDSAEETGQCLKLALKSFKRKGVSWIVDVDPQ